MFWRFFCFVERNIYEMILAMSDIKALTEIDYITVFLGVVVLLFAWKGAVMLKDWYFEKYGIETKKMKKEREDHELLIKTSQNLALLQEKSEKDDHGLEVALETFMDEVRDSFEHVDKKIEGFYENQSKYRGQSLEIQKEWTDKIDGVFNRLDEMQKRTDERFAISEEKTNKRVQSDIKERIAQSYRRYNISKRISRMELEALEDLIKTYESYKGMNSFVHSVVQKEMYTWEVVD